MIDDEELFKYYPEVESAMIQDTTPLALSKASSTTRSGADLEALFNPEVLLSDDGIAHALMRERVHAEVPSDGNLMDGVSRYVDEMYSENVTFDDQEDVSLEYFRDGKASLEIDLRYEPDTEFVSDRKIPGSLTVMGEVREEYRDELEDYNPSGRF